MCSCFLMQIFVYIIILMNSACAMYNPIDFYRLMSGEKNLIGANLQGAVLDNIDLSNVDFTNANLSGARIGPNIKNFTGTKFIRTNLRKAVIDHATSYDVVFDQVDLTEATVRSWDFERARISNTNFFQAKFYEINFRDSSLSGVNFSESNFFEFLFLRSTINDVNFSGSTVESSCDFFDCRLDNVSIQRCSLINFCISDCTLNNINLQNTKIDSGWVELNNRRNVDGRTWTNVDLRNSTIIDCWFFGSLILFGDDKATRNQAIKSLEMPWYYKLSLIANPLHAAKRMLSDNYDEYNINSAFIGGQFEGTIFLGVCLSNIALKNCTGVDSLIKSRTGCLFSNVIVENTAHGMHYTISDK